MPHSDSWYLDPAGDEDGADGDAGNYPQPACGKLAPHRAHNFTITSGPMAGFQSGCGGWTGEGGAAMAANGTPARVWVVEHVHKHGTDIDAYATGEAAYAARAEIARMYLANDLLYQEEHPGVNVDAMTDEEAVEAYFTAFSENECYVHDLEVQS